MAKLFGPIREKGLMKQEKQIQSNARLINSLYADFRNGHMKWNGLYLSFPFHMKHGRRRIECCSGADSSILTGTGYFIIVLIAYIYVAESFHIIAPEIVVMCD